VDYPGGKESNQDVVSGKDELITVMLNQQHDHALLVGRQTLNWLAFYGTVNAGAAYVMVKDEQKSGYLWVVAAVFAFLALITIRTLRKVEGEITKMVDKTQSLIRGLDPAAKNIDSAIPNHGVAMVLRGSGLRELSIRASETCR